MVDFLEGFQIKMQKMTVVSLINYELGNKDGRDPYDTEDGDSKSPKGLQL